MNDNKVEKKIKTEREELISIFEDVDANKMKFCQTLIDRLAWLNVNIKYVEDDINKIGAIVEYDNGGGQCGVRENPLSKVRAQYTKDITTITKQLIDLVPKSKQMSKMEMLRNKR